MTNESILTVTTGFEYKSLICAELLRRIDGDAELLSDLVTTFQAESPKLLTRIGRAIEARDSRELNSSAHACKGVLQTLSASHAAEVACELELMGIAGKVLGAEDLLVELENEMNQVLIELPLLDREYSRASKEHS